MPCVFNWGLLGKICTLPHTSFAAHGVYSERSRRAHPNPAVGGASQTRKTLYKIRGQIQYD